MNCKELGYKVGDEFEVKKGGNFKKGERIQLIQFDNEEPSIWAKFKSLETGDKHWKRFENLKQLEKTMDIKEAYKVMIKNCGIKVGDTVKVLRGWQYGELGNEIDVGSATKKIGETGKVTEMNDDDIQVNFGDGYFYYPFFVLEKVKDGVEPIELEYYTVIFKDNGAIKVGCQNIDFETVEKIYERAKSTR